MLGKELGRRAAELCQLRHSASRRHPQWADLYLTKQGIQQATDPEVARFRAAELGGSTALRFVYDATTGIGGDALELSAAGFQVVAGDLSPLTLRCARANLSARGHRAVVVQADAGRPPIKGGRPVLLLLDPDRRAGGRRSLDPARWSPSWDVALALAARFPGACLKLSPAFEPDDPHLGLPPGLDHRWQWISLRGELKEVALWTGELAGPGGGAREAVALDGAGGVARLGGEPTATPALRAAEAAAVAWIAEPDPGVIRSGLLGLLAREQGLRPVGPGIAYLGGSDRPDSPLLQAWRVVDSARADPRRVRAMLQRHGIGPVRVRKRGHPDAPPVLERRFRGRGRQRGELLVARLEEGHRAYLVAPCPRSRPGPV